MENKQQQFYKYFSIKISPKEVFFNIFVVLTVRFRTQNVRFRTLSHTLKNSLFSHYQAFIILAHFLLYNTYTNEQNLLTLKKNKKLYESTTKCQTYHP